MTAIVTHPDPAGMPYNVHVLEDLALERCEAAFTSYVGAAPDERWDIDYDYAMPDEDAWSAGHRRTVCYGYVFDWVEASLRGTGAGPTPSGTGRFL